MHPGRKFRPRHTLQRAERRLVPIPCLRRLRPLCVLLLHACVVGLAPIADARPQGGGPTAGNHIEPADAPSCPPAHDHLQCQLCRQMGPRLAASVGVEYLTLALLFRTVDAPPDGSPLEASRVGAPLGPRAPPAA